MPPAGAPVGSQGDDAKSPTVAVPRLSWMGPTASQVGETVEVRLNLGSNVPLRGMPLELTFSKDKLQMIDVQEGDFFRQGGAPTSFSKSGDGKDGTLRVGTLRNQATGAVGDGTLLVLRFKALASGPAEVRVSSAQSIGIGEAAAAPTLPPAVEFKIR